jgi:hypothetical protein
MLGVVEFVCPLPVELTYTGRWRILTAPGNSIAQSEMMRPEVNICFCFILITLISCKPEEHIRLLNNMDLHADFVAPNFIEALLYKGDR